MRVLEELRRPDSTEPIPKNHIWPYGGEPAAPACIAQPEQMGSLKQSGNDIKKKKNLARGFYTRAEMCLLAAEGRKEKKSFNFL